MNKQLNLGFRFIKMLDIGYVTIIYFLLAIIISVLLNKFYGEVDENEETKKMTFRKMLEIIGMIWLNGVIIYVIRNVVPFIPSPFNDIYGYKHERLTELKSAYVFDFVLIYTQSTLVKRIEMFFDSIKDYLF